MQNRNPRCTSRSVVALVFAALAPACIIAPERVNVDCKWTHDAPARLDDESHLSRDVAVAEELSIRYADAHYGYRSGHHAGARAYDAAQDQCLVTLFDTIAANHGVDSRRVGGLLHRRSLIYDVAVVFLPMTLLFCRSANAVVGWIRRRFTADEKLARTISLMTSSIVLTVVGLQVGSIWSFLSEEKIRLRTNHLSYRAFYLPWSRHAVAIAITGMCLFWVVVFIRMTVGNDGNTKSGNQQQRDDVLHVSP